MEYLGKPVGFGASRQQAAPFMADPAVTAKVRRSCAQLLKHAWTLGFERPAIAGRAGIECGRQRLRLVNDNSHFRYGHGLVESVAMDVDGVVVVRPLRDAFWPCFGEVRCDRCDENGQWRPPA